MNTYGLIHDRLVVDLEVLGDTEKCVDDLCPTDSGDVSLFLHEGVVGVELLSVQEVDKVFNRVRFQVNVVDVIYEAVFTQVISASGA